MSCIKRDKKFGGRANVNDLPNELLHQIFSCLDRPCSNKYLALNSKRFRVFDVLSRVNRRFRAVALPFLWRDIVVETAEEMNSITDYFRRETHEGPPSEQDVLAMRDQACLVRSIQVGRLKYTWYKSREYFTRGSFYRTQGAPLPYQNLRSFECYCAITLPTMLEPLARSPELLNLAVVWNDSYQFPTLVIHAMKNLQTLRMYLVEISSRSLPRAYFGPTSFPNITTLALHDATTFSIVIMQCLSMLTFPNLRVLRLERLESHVPDVYDFIQRHPTILEATVNFSSAALRAEALMKLIDGTGTWKSHGEVNAALLENPVPEDLDLECGPFNRFSFARRPLNSESMGWRSFRGSLEPRYECTGIALYFAEHYPIDVEIFDLAGFLLDTDPAFKNVQELRVATRTPTADADMKAYFVVFMRNLSACLRDRTALRMFSLYLPCPGPAWTWTNPEYESPTRTVPFLDDVNPPVFITPGKPRTLAQLCDRHTEEDVARIHAAIREVLCIAAEDPLDEDDHELLMRAWEARNGPVMARMVRLLALENEKLEEFEWYVLDNYTDGSVRWRWRIVREEGRPDACRIVADLTWTGCGRGSPPPFPVYVGQELDYALRETGGVYP